MSFQAFLTRFQKTKALYTHLAKLALVSLLAICLVLLANYKINPVSRTDEIGSNADVSDLAQLKRAYENQISNLQIKQSGQIIKILKDDDHGSRHQRFIVQIDSGQKLLIAHNIELAPRINGLTVGKRITFYGEYEWNRKGGVIHWTHRDPRKTHPDGWLLYEGVRYQ